MIGGAAGHERPMNSETPIDPLDSAEKHAELRVPASGAALPKRVVERLTLFLIGPQRAYNRGVIDAIRMLRADMARIEGRVVSLEQRMKAEGDEIAGMAAEVRSQVKELHVQVSDGLTEEALTRGQVLDIAEAVQRIEQRVAQLDATRPGD